MSKDAVRNAEREARLAEALRANLRKRKAQQRGEDKATGETGEDVSASEPRR